MNCLNKKKPFNIFYRNLSNRSSCSYIRHSKCKFLGRKLRLLLSLVYKARNKRSLVRCCPKPISQAPNHTTQMPQDVPKRTWVRSFPEPVVLRHSAEAKENPLRKYAPSSEASKNSYKWFSKENKQLTVKKIIPQGSKDWGITAWTRDTRNWPSDVADLSSTPYIQ